MFKLSYRFSLCLTALCLGFVGCKVSDSELPFDPTVYGGAGMDGAAGGDGSSKAGSGASSGAAGSGAAGKDSSGGAAGQAKGAAGSVSHGGGGVGGSVATGGHSAVGGNGGQQNTGGAGGSVAAAGSGGSSNESGGAGGSGGDTCPTDYTMATHIVINVSWPASSPVAAGSGEVHVWTKSRFTESGDSATIVSKSCGSVLPVITLDIPNWEVSIVGGTMLLPEIPDSAWDAQSMPTFSGTSIKSGNTITVNPGVALLGLSMSNPMAAWPAANAIMSLDQDGDGSPGISAIPKQGNGFALVPADSLASKKADKLYLAIRNIMTMSSTVDGCSSASGTGTANVTNFENHVIGCHIQGGNECNTTQRDFVDSHRTVFDVSSATFTTQRIDDSASCADVRALLPMN